ncbi:MAG TPA: hypothetical protein VGO80_16270 [Solirubrobacteraceae bacterium]|nr:hypothetical protein [Solirubrobacteraceae bacterium]
MLEHLLRVLSWLDPDHLEDVMTASATDQAREHVDERLEIRLHRERIRDELVVELRAVHRDEPRST